MPILIEIPVIFGLSIEVYIILFIIAVPTFFFWKWIFKKYIKAERKREIATWVVTLILTPLIYVGLILAFIFAISHEAKRDFNKTKWLTKREGRFEMGDDIVKSKLLIGKDTNQVKQILGTPTWGSGTILLWTYDMGNGAGGLGFLFHYLVISFEKERVVLVVHTRIRD